MEDTEKSLQLVTDCRDKIETKTAQIASIASLIISAPDDLTIADIRGAIQLLASANETLKATSTLLRAVG